MPEITKRIRPITGKVVQSIRECADTFTLKIAVDKADRNYIAGQFISINPHQFAEISEVLAYFEHEKGRRELVRAYSMASAPHEDTVDITIKPERYEPGETEYPPLLSPFLASDILVGRPLTFTGYTGAYILRPDHAEHTKEVVHIVAGSGIVPNFAILKDELENNKNTSVKHTLINVNRNFGSIIYRDKLEELHQSYQNRFQIVHYLTRETNPMQHGTHFRSGRPQLADLKDLVKHPKTALVYACGAGVSKWQKKRAKLDGTTPKPRFLEAIGKIIHALAIDRKRYKHEVYG